MLTHSIRKIRLHSSLKRELQRTDRRLITLEEKIYLLRSRGLHQIVFHNAGVACAFYEGPRDGEGWPRKTGGITSKPTPAPSPSPNRSAPNARGFDDPALYDKVMAA